jgi:hypothetical protein
LQPDAQGYIPGGEMNPNAPVNIAASNGTTPTQIDPNTGQPISNSSGGSTGSVSPNDVIRNLLTSPRPGGPPPGIYNPSGRPMNDYGFTDGSTTGQPPTPTSATAVGGGAFSTGSPFGGQSQGSTFGTPVSSLGSSASGGGGGFVVGSFAGVASTVKRPSIKIYKDHQKYNEWEFLYDYNKEVAAASGIPQGNQTNNPLAPGLSNSSQQNSSSPFGNSSNPTGTGTSPSPFGSGNNAAGTSAPQTTSQ